MHKLRWRGLLVLVAIFSLVAASACGEEPEASPTGGGTGTDTSSPAAEDDLLARIQEEGVIRIATDDKYKPASWFDAQSQQWMGFDVDVANEIALRLGVEAEINHQNWAVITAGSWNDRWDLSVGSMTVTKDRAELFAFTPAYYYTPASIAVHGDNTTIQDTETDLDGKRICVGEQTTYESYLLGDLVIPGYTFEFVIDDAQIQSYTTDTDALDQLALGDGVQCDAVMTATNITEGFIADGNNVKVIGDPLYGEPLSVALDLNSPIDNTSLVEEVSSIIDEMHADGTLAALSEKWWKEDLTTV